MDSLHAGTVRSYAGMPAPLRYANVVLDAVATVFSTITELMVVVMLLINAVNIVIRNLGFSSMLWVWPWTATLMVWSVFFAFFVMYRRDMDIRLVFIVRKFPRVLRLLINIAIAVIGLLVATAIVVETPQILNRQRGVIELVGLQRYWLSVPLLMSSALLVLHFIVEIVALLSGHAIDRDVETEAH